MINRAALKTATRRAHCAAEARWVGQTGFAGRHGYEGWLGVLHAAHSSLGRQAAAVLNDPKLQQAEQWRIAALESDLPGARQVVQAARPNPNRSYAWGVLYALNGSALGASSLLKSGAVPLSWPRSYLETLRRFAVSGDLATFFRQLDQAPLETALAVAGAHAVFDVVKGDSHVPVSAD